MKERINICLSCDNNYAQHLGVTIASILKNRAEDDEFRFIILDGNISDENKTKIVSLKSIHDFEIDFEKVDESLFSNCPIQDWTHLSIVTYFRLVLPDLRPDLKRIIYLDCDIVVRQSLRPLFDMEIGNNYIAGVIDVAAKKHAKRLGIENYINTGVLLFDVEKWRREDITNHIFDWISKNREKIVLHDQDILNAALDGHINFIDEKWNTFYLTRNLPQGAEKMEHACILHYIDRKKPWSFYNNDKFSKEYFEYLKLTEWKDFVNVYRVNKDIYELGVIEKRSPQGMKVRVYNLERTVCDFIKDKGSLDIETRNKAIKKCIKSKEFSASKMFEYAKKMNIYDRVKNYMEAII